MKSPTVINSDTLLPLSFISILLCGAIWLTNVQSQGVANAQAASEVKVRQSSVEKDIGEMRGNLIELKTELKMFHEEYAREQKKGGR